MNRNRKYLIGLSLIFLIVLVLVIFLLVSGGNKGIFNGGNQEPNNNNSSNNSSNNGSSGNNNGTNQNGNNNSSSPSESKPEEIKLSTLRTYSTFFLINDEINKYYLSMNDSDKARIVNMLDKGYKSLYGITEKNVDSFIKNNGIDVSYFAKKIYLKKYNKVYYYFVSGEEQYENYVTNNYVINDKVDYLIIFDLNYNSFSVTPLKVDSVLEYAQNYKIKSGKTIPTNSYNYIGNKKTTDEMISIYYLNYFKSMLLYSPERAYEMLSNDSKQAYGSYDAFLLAIPDLRNEIKSTILNYSVSGDNGKRIYQVICSNQKKLTFTENNIMDFKVTIR